MDMIRDEISEAIVASAKKITKEKSTGKITVRDILKDMDITNRVFYNRFHNIDEVLDNIYQESISKVRESLFIPDQDNMEYWDRIKMVARRTLILSYERKTNMSQYIFEADLANNSNFEWWTKEIENLILQGKKEKFIKKDIDEKIMSYSIWCFIKGFNADAMARKLSKKEALRQFDYGFGCLLDGMKNIR